jgi:predicted ATP-dependent protease
LLLPAKNQKDLVEVSKRAKASLRIVPVEHMDQVIDLALGEAPAKKMRPRKLPASKKRNASQVKPSATTTSQHTSL